MDRTTSITHLLPQQPNPVEAPRSCRGRLRRAIGVNRELEKSGRWEEERTSESTRWQQTSANSRSPSTGKISSREREIRNGIGGDDVPTRRIPRSKERPFEGAAMEVERRRPSMVVSGGGSRCDGTKLPLLRPERSLN